jgi:hypothetical protein
MEAVSDRRISLTTGLLLFNWPAEKIGGFYARLADEAPVDTCISVKLYVPKDCHSMLMPPWTQWNVHSGAERPLFSAHWP